MMNNNNLMFKENKQTYKHKWLIVVAAEISFFNELICFDDNTIQK